MKFFYYQGKAVRPQIQADAFYSSLLMTHPPACRVGPIPDHRRYGTVMGMFLNFCWYIAGFMQCLFTQAFFRLVIKRQ